MPQRMNSKELATLYKNVVSSHHSYPMHATTMHEAMKDIIGHLLADELEAEEFTEMLNAAEIEIAEDEGKY